MGMLDPADWKAEWIGFDKPRARPHRSCLRGCKTGAARLVLPPPAHLRTFPGDKPVRRATVYATALGILDLHLNGQRVSDDYFNPGWTDYTRRVYYRAYDVTNRFIRGQRPGGDPGRRLVQRLRRLRQAARPLRQAPALPGQLHLEYADGTTDIVAPGQLEGGDRPVPRGRLPHGRNLRRPAAVPGWDEPGFDDSRWKPVIVGAEVKPLVQAHPGPPVRPFAELRPKTITEPKPGVFVLDLGQNFAGVPRLKVHGEPGQKITLRFAERLNPDGTIYTTNLRAARAPIPTSAKARARRPGSRGSPSTASSTSRSPA